MTTDDMLLEVDDLKTYFFLTEGIVRAVDGLGFRIQRGQTLGVVGESGCGKSVTARSIMNMVRRPGRNVGGRVLYNRHSARGSEPVDLLALPPMGEEMRAIRGGEFSMIFQEPRASFSPVHTIGSQIIEAILLHEQASKAEARAYAIQMLASVKIPRPEQIVDAYPHQLSGGMCQRAMIALALACRPALLIADEPTTALDVTTEAQILDLMRELQANFDTAILYITHNLAVVAEIAEAVMVMYMGKDVEYAPVDAIFYNPKHPYTVALLSSIPRIDVERDDLTVLPGAVPDPYALPRGCPFHPRCTARLPICSEDVEVPYITVGAGHRVRCHLYA
ncbi:MAG: ABC transporter ATP-binding protein [Caldilineaceae bacterium]|nr:ABC transporter ATP-binding protein [Caldilineaceae bacterium]